jgi:hypothetical protein
MAAKGGVGGVNRGNGVAPVPESATDRPPMPSAPLYSCFDFRIRSAIPLPELVEAGQGDDRPIVDVRIGDVPEFLAGGGQSAGGLQVAEGTALLTVSHAARYLVRDGCEIIVDPLPGGSDRNVRLFLLGSALGLLCHQRGLLPLHANAIVIGNAAFAFAGPSGAGKSTLAAYFSRAGHQVLCDDVCVINLDDPARPLAWPGLPRLKLWGDASAAFGHDKSRLDPVIDGMDKYHVWLPALVEPQPIPFRRLYLLHRSEPGEETEIRRLRGRAAVEAIMSQTYRALYLPALGLASRHFLQCASLASRIEVYAATRAWGYETFEREAGRLACHLAEEHSQ